MKPCLIVCLLLLSTGFARGQAKDTTVNKGNIYTDVDQPAHFANGPEAFYRYLYKYIRYPEDTKRTKIEGNSATIWHEITGSVELTFVVEKNGTLTDVKVTHGISKELDAEMVRLIKRSPPWAPAKNEGEVVRQQYTFVIDLTQQEP
jgi:protein TonB